MSAEQFPQPNAPRVAEAVIAASPEELATMKEQGKDPIIERANEHEVYIYTKDQQVIDAIVSGNNWSAGDLTPDA